MPDIAETSVWDDLDYSDESEFEIQAYLFTALRLLGYNVRGSAYLRKKRS